MVKCHAGSIESASAQFSLRGVIQHALCSANGDYRPNSVYRVVCVSALRIYSGDQSIDRYNNDVSCLYTQRLDILGAKMYKEANGYYPHSSVNTAIYKLRVQ